VDETRRTRGGSIGRRGATVGALALAAALVGCEDGLFYDAPSDRPASITVVVAQGTDGATAAFDKVDNLAIEVSAGLEVLLATTVPVSANGGAIESAIAVDLPSGGRSARLDVTLRRADAELFTGATNVQLSPGVSTQATISLTPIVAGLAVSPPPLFTVFGTSTDLAGTAVFATGDPIPGGDVAWTSLDPGIVEVRSRPDGLFFAIARADGVASLRASFGSVQELVDARVAATVTTVEISPPSATLGPGETLTFAAVLRDAGGSVITSRAPIWASSNEAVATIEPDGTVTAVSPGSADITASRDGASATASLLVRTPGPDVTTLPAIARTNAGATAQALVDPRGSGTSVVFEYGTNADLTAASVTSPVTVSAQAGPTTVSRPLSGFAPNTTVFVRAVASNATGTTAGDIVSFVTLNVPQSPTGLSGFFISGSLPSVELTWQDNSLNETRFELERELLGGGGVSSVPARVFQPLASVGADVTLLNDTPPSGDLRYRVRACNADGCSPWSAPLQWTYGLPPQVSTLTATNVTDSDATVSAFVNPRQAPTTVVWQVSFDPTFTTPPPSVFPATPLDAGAGRLDVIRSALASGLSPGQLYYVRAVATNFWGTTVGNVVSFLTFSGG
jgi:hypothetical protein